MPDDGNVRSHRRHGEKLCSLNGKIAGAQSRHGAATVRGCVVNGTGAGGVNICARQRHPWLADDGARLH